MSSLTESIVEDAALEWFGELVPRLREVGHGPDFAPGEHAGGSLTPALSRGEREEAGEVVLVGRLRDSLHSLNPAISEEAWANWQALLTSSI
jgi:hypothetical protein